MEKLPMCRICLAENVRMYKVVNKNLHALYEKLTDIPFVTEDSRPNLVCFFCCAKLKQCYHLLRQCQEAAELFAQMMNEDYEHNPLINQNHLEVCHGFIKSPIESINIVDECQTENIVIKEELPAVSERLDDIIEPKVEQQSDDLEPENLDNSLLDVADIQPYHSESELKYDVPLIEFKTEVEEEQEVSSKKWRAMETKSPRCYVKKKLKMSSDGGTRSRQDNDGGMDFSGEVTSRNERDEIKISRKVQYKRATNVIDLHTDQSTKAVVRHVSKCQNFLNSQIGGPSTWHQPYVTESCSDYNDTIYNDTRSQVNYVLQLHEPLLTPNYVPNTQNILPHDVQNNTQLKMSSDDGKRIRQDDEEGADFSDDGMSQNVIDDIKKRRKLQNRIRCKRYRDKKRVIYLINLHTVKRGE